MRIRWPHVSFLPVMLIANGACAFVLVYSMMAWGPGANPDSIVYIEAAENLAAGKGLLSQGLPLTHYPPGYPLLLSLGPLAGMEMVGYGRLLHALLYAANAMLFTWLGYLCCGRSRLAAICLGLFYLTSRPVLGVQSVFWSEAPFLFASFSGFLLLTWHVSRPPDSSGSLFPLIGVSVFFGLAILTRYVGVTLLLPFILLILFSPFSWRRKARDIGLGLMISCVPLAFWLVRNMMSADSLTNRKLVWHIVGEDKIRLLAETVLDLALPGFVPLWLRAAAVGLWALLAVWGIIYLIRRPFAMESNPSVAEACVRLCLLFCASYAAFLLVSISLIDADTRLNDRIVLPAFLFLVPALAGLTRILSLRKPVLWRVFLALMVAMACLNGIESFGYHGKIRKEGRGFNSREWRYSQTMALAQALPPNMIIYSNGSDILRFVKDIEARPLPKMWSPYSLVPNPRFESELEDLRRMCGEGKAAVVLFNGVTWRAYFPSEARMDLQSDSRIERIRAADGVLYRAK